MPKDSKRVYNLQSKQIVKLFSRIFKSSQQDMLDDLAGGDVSETVYKFFEKSRSFKPAKESKLKLSEVDEFLEELSNLTQEDRQADHFEKICKKCTSDDLRTIIRLIKHDLKMNCGARHVLDALHPDAYNSFQKSRDLQVIIKEYGNRSSSKSSNKSGLQVMTAISPMLAEPCKDFDKAIKKCPDGFYSEIKYDGERVQIHKQGNEFKFFSRNLKPVMDHKVAKLKEFLPKAFPHGDDLIVDSEILMVDTRTGDLLPFGTLGKHKKEECSTAETCLFIFDCLYFNGKDLTKKPMKERRQFLEDNLTVIKHHVQLSEYKLLKSKNDLVEMTKEVLKKGLEGLVLKGLNTVYEPGKRRWLKVKKDYLLKGAIADTADLVVLGAWFGTGKMGGQYSIFLMGCYDSKSRTWKTVTKVHSGLDDREMERVHRKISPLMEKCDSNSKIPSWVQLNRTMIPNALAKDVNKMPVFEITGAEFTNSDVHTASSISIRFPRITNVRNDKSPEQATNLQELIHLYEESKAGINLDELNKLKNSESDDTKDKVTASIFTKLASTASTDKKRKPGRSDSDEPVTVVKRVKAEDDDSSREMKKERSSGLDEEAGLSGIKGNDTKRRDVRSSDVSKDSHKRKSFGSEAEESPAKKLKPEDLMFKDFLLFRTENVKEKYRDEIDEFTKLGGKITDESRKATLVLHDSKEIESSSEKLRKLYNAKCRHYQATWLRDSLKSKKLLDPLHFFVKQHQV